MTEKEQTLEAIQNFERFFTAPKFIPLNQIRVRLGLPEITREQIIEERKEQLAKDILVKNNMS